MEEINKRLELLIAKMKSASAAGALDQASLSRLEEVCSREIMSKQKDNEVTNLAVEVKPNINIAALAQLIKGIMETVYCPKGVELAEVGKAYDYIYGCLVSIKEAKENIKHADALYSKCESARIVAGKKDAPEQAKQNLANLEKQLKELCRGAAKEAVDAFKREELGRIKFYKDTIEEYAHFDIDYAVNALGKDDKPAEFLSQFDVSYNTVFQLENKTSTGKGTFLNGGYKLIIHPAKNSSRKLELKMTASMEYNVDERLNREEKFIAAVNAELAKKGIVLVQPQS